MLAAPGFSPEYSRTFIAIATSRVARLDNRLTGPASRSAHGVIAAGPLFPAALYMERLSALSGPR
jgi:hypothetical protein